MKRINIMTSCDNNLALYILPQLASIRVNLREYDVHFYLFHYRILPENLEYIKNFATECGIAFYEVLMQNADIFEEVAKHGRSYPAEAYAYLHCHEQLPDEIDRILYIDAGDIIIHGDISPYYFEDFEGNSFIATLYALPVLESGEIITRPLNQDDLKNPDCLEVLRWEYINAGSLVLNLKKMRNTGMKATRFLSVKDELLALGAKPFPCGSMYPSGDQGVLGVTFAGDIKLFGFSDIIENVMHTYPRHSRYNRRNDRTVNLYMPYNYPFSAFMIEEGHWYTPVILHYHPPMQKPWKYSPDKSYDAMSPMEQREAEMQAVWFEYAEMTPLGKNHAFKQPSIKKISPDLVASRYMAEHHLAHRNYVEAEKYIKEGLTSESDISVFTLLFLRLLMENNNDPERYRKSLSFINKNLHIQDILYAIYHYKGFCHVQCEEYREALGAYIQSYTLMQEYSKTSFIPRFTHTAYTPAQPDENRKWSDVWGTEGGYSHITGNNMPNPRLAREPLKPADNIECILSCCVLLGDYDEAFLWLERTATTFGEYVKRYFILINASGQIGRVELLFKQIEKMRQVNPEAAREGFDEFDKIVFSHPYADEIVAPFLDAYLKLKEDPK